MRETKTRILIKKGNGSCGMSSFWYEAPRVGAERRSWGGGPGMGLFRPVRVGGIRRGCVGTAYRGVPFPFWKFKSGGKRVEEETLSYG